ncbi:hypothetical protein PanWU01x14_097510 [Parasponia andersonii]|uniref:Uncharacterized protein n=1 Tax=Parasponia andersonii TaxID=3476 RepID=A0A2P5D4G8_PARAD|nr:hypothetical protein PanWU01x14_097510 [Parasponia andersonii]
MIELEYGEVSDQVEILSRSLKLSDDLIEVEDNEELEHREHSDRVLETTIHHPQDPSHVKIAYFGSLLILYGCHLHSSLPSSLATVD